MRPICHAVHHFNYLDAPELVHVLLFQIHSTSSPHGIQHERRLFRIQTLGVYVFDIDILSVPLFFLLRWFAPICAQYFYYLFAFGHSNQNRIEKQIEAKYTNQKSIKCLSVRPIGHSPFNWSTLFPIYFCCRWNTRFCIYNLTVNIFILLTTIGGPVHIRGTRFCSFAF